MPKSLAGGLALCVALAAACGEPLDVGQEEEAIIVPGKPINPDWWIIHRYFPSPHDVDVADGYAYWSADADIYRRPVAGGTTERLCGRCGSVNVVHGIAPDPAEGFVYYVSQLVFTGELRLDRVRISTGQTTPLAIMPPILLEEYAGEHELLIDATSVYWWDTTLVYRYSKSSGMVTTLARIGAPIVDMDVGDGYLYLSLGKDVARIGKDGSSYRLLASSDTRIEAIDVAGTQLYFVDAWTNVFRVDASGETPPVMVAPHVLPVFVEGAADISVDPTRRWLYTAGSRRVSAVSLTSGSVVSLYNENVKGASNTTDVNAASGDLVVWRSAYFVFEGTLYGDLVADPGF